MKYTLIFIMLSILGCGTESNKILVSGQSNALRCDWSYFESLSGIEVINISIGGCDIECLIDNYIDSQEYYDVESMIFVHGETDAKNGVDGNYYVSKVNDYINLTGVSNVYFSLVGYRVVDGIYGNADQEEMNSRFDIVRNSVFDEIEVNSAWSVGFSDAKHFHEWGMLSDHVHFNKEGCQMMMREISLKINPD